MLKTEFSRCETPTPPGKRQNGGCLPPRAVGFAASGARRSRTNSILTALPSLSLEVCSIYMQKVGILAVQCVIEDKDLPEERGMLILNQTLWIFLDINQGRLSVPWSDAPSEMLCFPMVCSSSRAGSMLRSDDDGHNCL